MFNKPEPFDDEFYEDDRCVLCWKMRTRDGHDPCIANLPGVIYACCGHGKGPGYMKFEDGRCLRFVPVEMDLDAPTHDVVERVPVFLDGEKPRIFNFEAKKVSRKTVQGHIVESAIISIERHKRK